MAAVIMVLIVYSIKCADFTVVLRVSYFSYHIKFITFISPFIHQKYIQQEFITIGSLKRTPILLILGYANESISWSDSEASE